jgi:fibronectin-binding autotransporter adhesin
LTITSVIQNAANPAPVSLSLTSASNQVLNANPNGTLYVGMPVSGTGIPAGDFITAVNGTTTTLNANATTTSSQTITFTSANQLSKGGLGTLILAANNTITGTTVVGQGTLAVSSANALATSDVYLGDGGTLTALSDSKVGGLTGTGTVLASPTAMLTIGGTTNANETFYGRATESASGGNLTINKGGNHELVVFGNASLTGTITVAPASRLSIRNPSWANSPAGITVQAGSEVFLLVNMTNTTPITLGSTGFSGNNGALHIGGNATVLSNSPISLTANSNIKLDSLLSFTQNGNINTNGNTLILQSDTGTTATVNGIISGNNGSLSVSSGAWTLTGANTYTGTTNIIGGANNLNATVTATTLGQVGGAASNLGQAVDPVTSGITLGSTGRTGTLLYNGTGELTDRNVTLGGGGTINNAGAGPLTFAGAVNLAASTLTLTGSPDGRISGAITATTGGITMTGAGTWTIGNSATFGALAINAGTIAFNSAANSSIGAVSGVGALSKAGAGLLSVTNLKPASVSINGGAVQVRQNGASNNVSVTSSLSVSGGAKLDLVDNDLIVKYTGSSIAPAIRSLLVSGFNNGTWDGAGIDSSAASPTLLTGLGYADSAVTGAVSFDGQAITTAVVVKYTYYGDNNLDGTVTTGDFQMFLDGLTGNGSTWTQGDYTYDGKVDLGNDFNLFLASFLKQGGALGDLAPLVAADTQLSDSQRAAMLSVVPEPASAALITAMGGLAIGSRRRRRHKTA